MKTRIFLITTILSAAAVLSIGGCSKEEHQDSHAAQSGQAYDSRLVANRFVKHISYARMELAMKHTDRAKQHIAEARNLETIISGETSEQRNETDVKSGRVMLTYNDDYKYYYFPIETGTIPHQKPSNPMWIQKGPAITDAEIVSLTLDMNAADALQYLDDAETAINQRDIKKADTDLAKLNDEVITDDDVATTSLDKASSNIALAHRFIMDSNYKGARYALGHADEALNEMEQDDTYKGHHDRVVAMRKQIKSLRATIDKNDRGMMQQADDKVEKWWKELKGWAQEKTS